MSVQVFAAADKDYIAKLNAMSSQAGDVQQHKADAAQSVIDAQAQVSLAADEVALAEAALALAITAKNQAEAIALGDINHTNPDFASVKVAGADIATALAKTNIFAFAGMVM